MKDINGNDLQQPYYDLAVMRREQKPDNTCLYGFELGATPEKYDWWFLVFKGSRPPIPDTSLAELEAWRKEKQPADTTDWKAKYEELLQKHADLFNIHQKAMAEFDQVTSEPSNFIAECAMRAMQGYITSEEDTLAQWIFKCLGLPEDTEYNWLIHYPQYVAKISFDYAEAMAAEGKKRGHLPNTENDNE